MIAFIQSPYFYFEKGNVTIRVSFFPFHYSEMIFEVEKKDYCNVIFLKEGSHRYKKFISIYFNNENLVQLLLKYPKRRKFISDMFKAVKEKYDSLC